MEKKNLITRIAENPYYVFLLLIKDIWELTVFIYDKFQPVNTSITMNASSFDYIRLIIDFIIVFALFYSLKSIGAMAKKFNELKEDVEILDFISHYRALYTYGTYKNTKTVQVGYHNQEQPMTLEELYIIEKANLREHLLKNWHKTGPEIDKILGKMYKEVIKEH